MKVLFSLLALVAASALAEELEPRGEGVEAGGYPTPTYGYGGGGYSTTTEVIYTTSTYTYFFWLLSRLGAFSTPFGTHVAYAMPRPRQFKTLVGPECEFDSTRCAR